MCHATEYDHLIPEAPEPETNCSRCVAGVEHGLHDGMLNAALWAPEDHEALMRERSRLRALAGLPLEADALAFAVTLR